MPAGHIQRQPGETTATGRGRSLPESPAANEPRSFGTPECSGDSDLNQADGENDQRQNPADSGASPQIAVAKRILIQISDDSQPAVLRPISRAMFLQQREGKF